MQEETFNKQQIREITVKSALHFHANEMPTNYDVNVYRGCAHGCRYCFAQYSHNYLDAGNFFREIYAKKNVAEILDRELSRKSWKKYRINLSGVTDCYQPAEASRQLMPDVWRVLIRNRNPVILTTKSSLILRDLELIAELAGVTSVCIGASITIMDNTLCRLVEPGAAIADERFRALRECKNAGCHTHVLLTPVLPYLNDSMENLESIYFHASEVRVNGISAWPLNLRGSTRKQFFGFLRLYFPHLQKLYEQLFVNGSVDKEYSAALKQKVKGLHQKYGLPEIKLPEIPQPEFIQLTLF